MLIQIFNTDFDLVNLLLFPKNLGHTFDSKIQMIVTSETSTCEKRLDEMGYVCFPTSHITSFSEAERGKRLKWQENQIPIYRDEAPPCLRMDSA